MPEPEAQPGHEATVAIDPFELSDKDFQAQLSAKKAGEDIAPAQQEPADTEKKQPAAGDSEPDTETKGAASDTTPDPTKPLTDDGQSKGTSGDDQQPADATEFEEIVHNGEVHRLTRDQIRKLAQKGFDYDRKVGPHQRIVALIDTDPGAARVLNDYVKKRMAGNDPLSEDADAVVKPSAEPDVKKPKLKPLNEFDSETEWLEANVNEINKGKLKDQTESSRIEKIQSVLVARDPDNYFKVAPQLTKFSKKLTIEQAEALENATRSGNLEPLTKFYDYVKSQVLKPAAPAAPAKPSTPAFRAKPGGGEPPRNPKESPDFVWNMPAKDFKATLARLKGYT